MTRRNSAPPKRTLSRRKITPAPKPTAHPKKHPAAKPKGGQPQNTNAESHGFYSAHYTGDEIARLIKYCTNKSIEDEIGLARVANDRLTAVFTDILDKSETDDQRPDVEQIEKIAGLLFNGLKTVSKLMRDNRILNGEEPDGLAGAMAQALDELREELALPL